MYLRLNFLPPPRVGVMWRCKQDYIYLKEINTNAGVYGQIHSYACQKTKGLAFTECLIRANSY